jgi:hypothetical protein
LNVAPYEVDIANSNGELRQFEINAKKVDYRGQPADLVICRDVTQRKKYEKQLKEYAEKLEWLVEKKQAKLKKVKRNLEAFLILLLTAL